jgi:hypothetical protein
MAEWLRRQIRMVIDLSDGVSPRRFKSCSGSGVLWILFFLFCTGKVRDLEVGPGSIMLRRFLFRGILALYH